MLPSNQNPLNRRKIYETLGIDHVATDNQISAALERCSARMEQIQDEAEKRKHMATFQEAVSILKDTKRRMLINALIPNVPDRAFVEDKLQSLPSRDTMDIQLPKPGLADVFIEGESAELAELDYTPVAQDPTLEINFEQVYQILQKEDDAPIVLFEQ